MKEGEFTMKKKFSINDMPVKLKIRMFTGVMLAFMVIIAGVGLFTATNISKVRANRYQNYAMSQYYMANAFTNFANIKVCTRNILFYYYEELTLKEISSILEVSESRISQLHTRALQKMKTKMGKYMGILTEH